MVKISLKFGESNNVLRIKLMPCVIVEGQHGEDGKDGKDGTIITIGGEQVAVLPIDEYIEQNIDQIVGETPESLNTLQKIANALQNDPDFAENIKNLIGGKLDKYEGAYSRIYGTKNGGAQMMYTVSSGTEAYSVAYRGADGVLGVGRAKTDIHAVPLAQMNEALTEKAGTKAVQTLAKKVENLEAGVAPDMFMVDDATAYVKDIPTDAKPYAVLLSVGGMTYKVTNDKVDTSVNYFDIAALDGKMTADHIEGSLDVANGTVQSDMEGRNISMVPIKELFPSLKVGEHYMLFFDSDHIEGTLWLGSASFHESGKFLLTDAIYNGEIGFEGYIDYTNDEYIGEPIVVTFSNIRIYGYETDLIDTKVTALDIVGKNLYNGGFGGNACATEENGVLTMTKTSALDRYSAMWNPPVPIKGFFIYANVIENKLASSVNVEVVYDDGTTYYPLVVGTGANGIVTAKLAERISEYNIKSIRPYIQNSEAIGVSIKMKDIMILPTSTPTDTTFSPYHKTTFAIPAEVQSLDGYGWGINANVHNGVEWDDNGNPVYVQRVKRVVYDGTETGWYKSSYENAVQYADSSATYPYKKASGSVLCNKYKLGTPSGGLPCMHDTPLPLVYYPDNPPDTVEGWKAMLAQWYAEGNPLVTYYELAEPIVTDVSAYFTEDNLIAVEGGGTITAVNTEMLAAPTTIIYQKRGA